MTNALDNLISGFNDFREQYFETETELFDTLSTAGQTPHTLVIACSDSRIDPALIFSAEPGDLFVVRNVANLVPAYTPNDTPNSASTAIEYAVRDLKVSHIVVLGHAQCGGIKAACSHVSGADLSARDFLESWVHLVHDVIAPEVEKNDLKTLQRRAEQASIQQSVKNLHSFPWIADEVQSGRVTINGWWFDLKAGALWAVDERNAEFRQISGV